MSTNVVKEGNREETTHHNQQNLLRNRSLQVNNNN